MFDFWLIMMYHTWMLSPNRASELLKPFLVIFICIFMAIQLYNILFLEDEDDDFSVTVTYDCRIVLDNRNNYPDRVIALCEQLRESLWSQKKK